MYNIQVHVYASLISRNETCKLIILVKIQGISKISGEELTFFLQKRSATAYFRFMVLETNPNLLNLRQ